jgi:nitroreductase
MSSDDNIWRSQGRAFLKSDRWEEWRNGTNDQRDGVPVPALQKPAPTNARILPLPDPKADGLGQAPLVDVVALDAGHVCQNLYLAATAVGAGVCAIDAYDQSEIDAALGVDGQDEFTVYCAAVGKLA